MPRPLLIVDDNSGDRALIRAAFADREVREAASLEEGLAALEASPPAVILLDLGMPGLQGVEALEAIVTPAHRRGAAVVVFSAKDPADWASEAYRRGADGFVHKKARTPDSLRAVLLAEMQAALRRREYQRQQGALVGERIEALCDLIQHRIPADLPAKVEALAATLAPLPGTLAAIERHLAALAPAPPPGAPAAPESEDEADEEPTLSGAPASPESPLRRAWKERGTAFAAGLLGVLTLLWGWILQTFGGGGSGTGAASP